MAKSAKTVLFKVCFNITGRNVQSLVTVLLTVILEKYMNTLIMRKKESSFAKRDLNAISNGNTAMYIEPCLLKLLMINLGIKFKHYQFMLHGSRFRWKYSDIN